MARRGRTRVASHALAIIVALGCAVSAAPQKADPAALAAVSIPAEDQYRFGDAQVERRELPQRIADALRDAPPQAQVVDLIVGEAVRYGTVRVALTIIRETGFDRVRFAVRRADARGAHAIMEATIVQSPPGTMAESSDLPPATYARRPRDGAPPPPAPEPPRVGPLSDPSVLFVEVKAGPARTVAVNRREVRLSQLRTFLSGVISDRPDHQRHVLLKAPKEAAYGEVASLMLDIEAAGASGLLLVIDEVEGPPEIVPVPPRPPAESGARSTPDGPPGTIRVTGGVLAGKAIKRPQPRYPERAGTAGIEGRVVVEVIVDEAGHVTSARAVSGHPLLRDAAVEAARGWTFAPTRHVGVAVKVVGTITFNFGRN